MGLKSYRLDATFQVKIGVRDPTRDRWGISTVSSLPSKKAQQDLTWYFYTSDKVGY